MENSLTTDISMAAYINLSFSCNSKNLVHCYHCKEKGHKHGHIITKCRRKSGPDKSSTTHKAFQVIARNFGTQETPILKAHQTPTLLDWNDIYKGDTRIVCACSS
ncbi:hypothetical protein H5410_027947 [Solanum commersonii]|uniref:Uncharacterized protein n=1 Tax=Solanum commersonii TaxID=4109 RepID=A0A9J5Z3K1_SOLCO|nr:hypothetical protein H5410_027947 [Solanum commersonii]